MLILRRIISHNHLSQKGVPPCGTMSKDKVEKKNRQVKLVFGEVGEAGFNLDRLAQELGLEFHAFAVSAGVLVMKMLMEAEEDQLAGPFQSHETEINRWGKQAGSVMVGGQKVQIDHPRLRTRAGEEVKLSSCERFGTKDDRARAVYQRMLAGVSCRDYEQTVEAVADGYGVSKSVVNREVVQATAKDLALLCERDLSKLDLSVLMVDGVKVGSVMETVALGLILQGKNTF